MSTYSLIFTPDPPQHLISPLQIQSSIYSTIITVYRPHTDSINNCTLQLESVFKSSYHKNAKLVLLAGDMNVNLLDMKCAPVKNYVCMPQSQQFLSTFTEPTTFSNN